MLESVFVPAPASVPGLCLSRRGGYWALTDNEQTPEQEIETFPLDELNKRILRFSNESTGRIVFSFEEGTKDLAIGFTQTLADEKVDNGKSPVQLDTCTSTSKSAQDSERYSIEDLIIAALMNGSRSYEEMREECFSPAEPDRLRKSLDIPDDEEVYLLYDDSGEDGEGLFGFALTTTGIYASFGSGFVSWAEFKEGDISIEHDDIGVAILHWSNGEKFFNIDCDFNDEKLRAFGDELQQLIVDHWGNFENIPSEQIRIEDRIEFALRSAGFDEDNHLNRCYSRENSAILRKKLCVPTGEEVYLAHDDSILKNGKKGFILTKNLS